MHNFFFAYFVSVLEKKGIKKNVWSTWKDNFYMARRMDQKVMFDIRYFYSQLFRIIVMVF